MISVFIQLILVLTFAVSSISKIFGYTEFRNVLNQFGFSGLRSHYLAVAIILCETLASAFMLTQSLFYLGLLMTIGLSVVFVGASMFAMFRKQNILCSCFGDWLPDRLGKATLVKAGAIALLALFLIASSTENPLYELHLEEALFALLPACGVFLLYALATLRRQYVETKRKVLNLPSR